MLSFRGARSANPESRAIISRFRVRGFASPRNDKGRSTTLSQSCQHFQSAIAVGWRQSNLGLIIPHGLHGVIADPAVGAAGVKAGLGQARLQFLDLGQRQRALGAGERLDERRSTENAVTEMT